MSGARRAAPLAVDAGLGLAGGALYSLPFVFTWAWPLQWLLIAALARRANAAGARRAAALGLAFGSAWLLAATWWLFVSLHRYGGLAAPLAALAVGLLALALGLYLAAALALFAHGSPRAPGPAALRFGACWLLAELARGVLFTGFPWVASGYGQIDAPLAALAPWIGVYGVGALAAAAAAWAWPGTWRDGWRLATVVGALGALAASGPMGFTRPAGALDVTLLQTDVPQDEKFDPGRVPQSLGWLTERLLGARPGLVIAPETAIPLLPEQLDPAFWQPLLAHFGQPGHAALVGLPLGSYERGYTNSALGLSDATTGGPDEGVPRGAYRYDKHHLVPFGEFIPRGFRWFTELMNIPLGDFDRGPLAAPSFAFDGQRVAPTICYEDLFGEELAARFGDDAQAPTLLANLSNIGWFGDTIAIAQHLAISRFRTLEFQRPMLRATNTGATAAIDHEGRVLAQLAPFTLGTLESRVHGREGRTPFARWCAAFGLAPLALAALLLLAATHRGRP